LLIVRLPDVATRAAQAEEEEAARIKREEDATTFVADSSSRTNAAVVKARFLSHPQQRRAELYTAFWVHINPSAQLNVALIFHTTVFLHKASKHEGLAGAGQDAAASTPPLFLLTVKQPASHG
jgi:hypothetical protein